MEKGSRRSDIVLQLFYKSNVHFIHARNDDDETSANRNDKEEMQLQILMQKPGRQNVLE